MANPVDVQNLTKSFSRPQGLLQVLLDKQEKYTILDEVSFYVEPGEYLGVVGKNGVGKSTLLRVLGGIYAPDSGMVVVRGSIASIYEMGTFMNQQQTARAYCKQYLELLTGLTADIPALIESILEFTELGLFFDAPIHTFSAGMQAKLLFALATVQPADVLLIDEVLVVGDMYFQNRAWKRLRGALGQTGCGIIVSHDWVSLLKLCKRAMILENHKVKMIGFAGPVLNVNQGLNEYDSDYINIVDKEKLQAKEYTVESGEDFTLQFQVFVKEFPIEGVLGASFYIERYVVGEGWNQVLFLQKDKKITELGLYTYTFHIPKIPLAPGKYQIALELFLPLKPGEPRYSTVYTKMNWLRGNSLALHVTGNNPDDSIIRRRLEWKITAL